MAAKDADTFVGGDGTDVGPRTAAQVRTSLGLPARLTPSTTGALLILDASSGVTLASGRASAVASQVGALSVTQPVAGNRPLLVSGALNGWDALAGTAARNDHLAVTDPSVLVADPLFVTVCRAVHNATIAGQFDGAEYRWSLFVNGNDSDYRIDATTAAGQLARADDGGTLARWDVYVHRVATRQMRAGGAQVFDGTDRTPTYAGTEITYVGATGVTWAWWGLYDGATALSGTTFEAWAAALEGALASRFGLALRPAT